MIVTTLLNRAGRALIAALPIEGNPEINTMEKRCERRVCFIFLYPSFGGGVIV